MRFGKLAYWKTDINPCLSLAGETFAGMAIVLIFMQAVTFSVAGHQPRTLSA